MKMILFCLVLSVSLNAQSDFSDDFTLETASANYERETPVIQHKGLFKNKKVDLPSGTLVVLASAEQLISDQATIGQMVKFIVKTNVTMKGKVVIATGAMAVGRIKNVNSSTYNHPATINVEVTSVQAVDGQQVALNGNEMLTLGIYKGQGTKLQTGRTIISNVMNDMVIVVK